MSIFGSTVFIVVAAVAVIGIVVALVVGLGRKTDWAGDPRPPQQPTQPPEDPHQSPYEQQQPPRSIDDSQRFREQNRPTDPPAPA